MFPGASEAGQTERARDATHCVAVSEHVSRNPEVRSYEVSRFALRASDVTDDS